ncbi:MAG: patatin-like phospholipase family protein [Candidatus Nanopelagicales bacterium]
MNPSTDGLHWPISFDSRYGQGLDRTISFGGGGVFFVAWQVGYLKGLAEASVPLKGAERVVGTSAGSIVAALFSAKKISGFYDELRLLSKVPQLVSALAPAVSLKPSQAHAVDLFSKATTADPDVVRDIGRAALAAQTPEQEVMRRNILLVVRMRHWPSEILHTSAVDTYTGERCIVSSDSGLSVPLALAASSAIPGVFPPQQLADRKCMDGGTSGTGTHLDVLAGSKRALILRLRDPKVMKNAEMTQSPKATIEESDSLKASGTEVFAASPESFTQADLMDASAVGKALAMGIKQGSADAQRVNEFWND